MTQKSTISLILIAFLVTTIFVFSDVFAAASNEIVSVTVDLQTILLEPDQVIPLLDTKSVANMSKLQISATLPCESNNTPKLKIIAGALGNLTGVIDSSSDYKNLRGPFDSCYYEGTISTSTNLPVLNKVFLKNDGTSSVVTNLGSIVTLTGMIPTNQSQNGDFIEATGGTITTDGNYKVHTFSSSGTFQITSGSGVVEYLVIAGGGGGGVGAGHGGGGGGAGGYKNGTLELGPDSYEITVGSGGTGASSVAAGSDGSNSVFHNITSTGGGGGGKGADSGDRDGHSGGSGGGGGGTGLSSGAGTGGSGTTGQGNAGGNGENTNAKGGGGGGAGGAGVNGVSGGAGGTGLSSDITGEPVVRAKGGKGGTNSNDGASGAANTGEGGGGSASTTPGGGNGGSGVVILRYQFQ